MPNPSRLQILIDLRRETRPRLSQDAVATIFGLDARQGRKTVGAWELGQQVPDKNRRTRFIGYLWDDLKLRNDPVKFEEVWTILTEEWRWDPIADAEWRSFTNVPRPSHSLASAQPVQAVAETLTILTIPEPVKPPFLTNFVGRAQELQELKGALQTTGAVVIAGLIGVGKTTIAAKLVEAVGTDYKVFWHVCYETDGVDSIIWKLAEFLAWDGEHDLLYLLEKSVERRPTTVLLDYLFQSLRKQNTLLCLDDFHHIATSSEQQAFVDRLCSAVQAGYIKLIITSQHALGLKLRSRQEALKGFTLKDTQDLLVQQKITLTDDALTALYQRTEGNAALLMLAVNALIDAEKPELIIDRLVRASQVKQFLLEEVDKTLHDQERAIMSGTAALLGFPGTADVIEELLAPANIEVRRMLALLSNRYLLREIVNEESLEFEYTQHAIMQAFYYELLSRRHRRTLHARAAEYYLYTEKDPFRAALHYCYADEQQQAAQLLTDNLRIHLYRGRSGAIRRLLEQFDPASLQPELWGRILLARGDVYGFLDEVLPAKTSYEAAIETFSALEFTESVRTCMILAYRGLGVLLRTRKPAEAIERLQQGLHVIADNSPLQEADLQIQMGIALRRMQNNEQALFALKRGLGLLPPIRNSRDTNVLRLHFLALNNLGIYHYVQGDLQQSIDYLLQAQHVADKLGDPFNALAIRINLTGLQQTIGRWSEAVTMYGEAIELAQKLGNHQEQARVSLNFGVLQMQLGNYEEAYVHLSTALERAQQIENNDLLITSSVYLADLHLRNHKPDAALMAVTKAEEISLASKIEYQLPLIYTVHAGCDMVSNHSAAALTWAKRAVESAQHLGVHHDEGIALRTVGEIQTMLGELTQAEESFSRSAAMLEANPYEFARTQAKWGSCLMRIGKIEPAVRLLQQACVHFQQLGAMHDFMETQQLLRSQ